MVEDVSSTNMSSLLFSHVSMVKNKALVVQQRHSGNVKTSFFFHFDIDRGERRGGGGGEEARSTLSLFQELRCFSFSHL